MVENTFIYLVQGQRELVSTFLHLADRPQADALFLTYDEPLHAEGAIFFPNSTWAEGRNRLLEEARQNGSYRYYIYSDDDVEFERGGWQDLEDGLLAHTPAIGVPVVPKTYDTTVPFSVQPFRLNDEQVMGLHHDVVEDNLIVPYQTRFDDVHWWASCQIQQILIQSFYHQDALQFNGITVRNECAGRYANPDEGRSTYKTLLRDWLATQFVDSFRDIQLGTGKYRWRAWRRAIHHTLRTLGRPRASTHCLSPSRVMEMLTPGSALLEQYQNRTLPVTA
ncbi:MAG: hypothetical protein Rubg2KO_09520 [Rubricoccaceae bacterium]